jgi:hypothetical protein
MEFCLCRKGNSGNVQEMLVVRSIASSNIFIRLYRMFSGTHLGILWSDTIRLSVLS